ncbi:MAG: argininosuccinate lyase [Phycisphaerae bacterium]|nr:argininosuccinate lyase [Phycisphaerae bacterium]
MTSPIWDKTGASVDADAMAFMSRDDVLLDRELLPHDIVATRAHVRGLRAIDLLSEADASQLDASLADLAERFASGSFVLDERYEDGHAAIEAFLTDQLGDVGKRVHLGRSRNDQVAVALRLYMRATLDATVDRLLASADAALLLTMEHQNTPMPGYTHLQRAVPSSVGLWMGSFAEGFADASELCLTTRGWLNTCPLGTAAGYGVTLPLAREAVASELGFDRVHLNPMAVQAARGRIEHHVIATLWQAMQEVRRLAWDLSLFSSEEFGFLRLGPGFVTGSSIMPNKSNPDMAELLRASTAVVGGAMSEIQQAMSLPSGYHRDLQVTKPALIRAAKVTLEALAHVPRLIATMTLDEESMRRSIDPSMFATDRAVELSSAGMPFRDAYRQTADELARGDIDASDAEASLQARVSLGACGNLGLDLIKERLKSLRQARK